MPAILPTIDLNKVGVEDIDGRPYYHLNTTTEGEYIAWWTLGMISQGAAVVDVWIDAETFVLRRVTLAGQGQRPCQSERVAHRVVGLRPTGENRAATNRIAKCTTLPLHLASLRHNPYLILALVALGVFVAAADLTVVSTMLPQMIFDFQIPVPAGLDDAAWIVSAYLIAYVVTMPFMGRVSDVYGRRLVYVISMLIFAAGSLHGAAGFHPPSADCRPGDPGAGRRRHRPGRHGGGSRRFPGQSSGLCLRPVGRRRHRRLGLGANLRRGRRCATARPWEAGWPACRRRWRRWPAWGWQWPFYVNIPIGLAVALLAWWALAGLKPAQTSRSLDWVGAALLTAALVVVNIGLSKSGGQAASAPTFDFSQAEQSGLSQTLPWFAGGLLAFGLFIWVESRAAHPIIDLRMFRLRNFTLACLVNFVVGFVLIVAMVDVPLFVNSVLAQGGSLDELLRSAALESGQILTALTAAMAVASVVGGWLCGRFGYRLPSVAGLLMTAAGFALMSTWGPDESRGRMALHLALGGFGFGLVTSPVATATIDAVAPGPARGGIGPGAHPAADGHERRFIGVNRLGIAPLRGAFAPLQRHRVGAGYRQPDRPGARRNFPGGSFGGFAGCRIGAGPAQGLP